MKSLFLAALTILVAQGAMATNLRPMQQQQSTNKFEPGREEKMIVASISSASETVFINFASENMMCVVPVNTLAEAAAILSAVKENSTVECYVGKGEVELVENTRKRVLRTTKISIINSML